MVTAASMTATVLGVDWSGHAAELQTVAAVLVAFGVIGRLVVLPVWRFFKRLETVVLSVEAQFRKNGGSTSRDQGDRTEEKVDMVIEQLGIHVPDRLKKPAEETP